MAMKKCSFLLALFFLSLCAMQAQDTYSLDSLRRIALSEGRAPAISRARVEKAEHTHQAARTNFFPKIALAGGYLHTGKSISLLSGGQQQALSALGTNVGTALAPSVGQILQQFPDLAPLLSPMMQQMGESLNHAGQGIVDALQTNTRNVAMASLMLQQPLYMGGKIRAYNRLTKYARSVAERQLRTEEQEVILSVDQAYWQVVSLTHKKRLAEKHRDMLAALHGDMQKMIAEGLATKAAGLNVEVKLGEAEMTLLKVDDGLVLSRMLLCELCGLPVDENIRLADEWTDDEAYLRADGSLERMAADCPPEEADVNRAFALRPELESLRLAADIYGEKVKIERATFLPQLALVGGYGAMTPSLFNGFEQRFRGTWNVGLTLAVPIWNWGEGYHKIKAGKADVTIAHLQLEDAKEKIALQVKQADFRTKEARERFRLSTKNLQKADENLRTAELGFKEGVIATTDMLAAQTMWIAAQSDRVDAIIDLRMADSMLKSALGTLY